MQGFSQKYSPRCNRYSRTFCPMSLTVFCNGRLRNLLYGGLWITLNKVPRRRDLGQIGWLLYRSFVESYAAARRLCASWFPRRLLLGKWRPRSVTRSNAVWEASGFGVWHHSVGKRYPTG